MLLLDNKDEELESEKEKGIQTRSMLKKVEEEKIKIAKMRKKKALRKMLRLKEITITQKERTITQLIIYQHLYRMQLNIVSQLECVEGRRRLRGRLSYYNGKEMHPGDEWYFCN